jgi:hypothetical protein
MNAIIALTLSTATLYAWAGVCFLFFRFIRPETQERQRRFLQDRYSFFTERAFSQTRTEVRRETIQEAGTRGWVMTGLPVFTLSFGLTYTSVLTSCAVLFFGGLMFAYSWYGLRCLRMLGLDVYAKPAA